MSQSAVGDDGRDMLTGTLMVGFSAVLFGLIPFFARNLLEAGLAPPAIAFYRYMISAVALLPFLRLRGTAGRASLWAYGAGFCVGLGWVGYVIALGKLPVAVAGVLYMTYPLFTLLIGWAMFALRPSPRAMLGAAMILAAAALAARAGTGGAVTPAAVVLALAAPLAFGLSINVLSERLGALRPFSRMSAFALGSSTGLVPLILTYPAAQVIPAEPRVWLEVAGLGLFAALVPQFIYTTYVPRIGGARSAALGAIELPTMFLVGYLAFGESVDLRAALAGALVLTAIVLTPTRPRPAQPAATPERPDKETDHA